MLEVFEFLKRAIDYGRIVPANELRINEVAHAQAEGRILTDGEVAYVLLPWETSTRRDRDREREYFGPRESKEAWEE